MIATIYRVTLRTQAKKGRLAALASCWAWSASSSAWRSG